MEAARVWGPFHGQVFRGVRHAFPEATVARHDPVAHFPSGQPGGPPARVLHWWCPPPNIRGGYSMGLALGGLKVPT